MLCTFAWVRWWANVESAAVSAASLAIEHYSVRVWGVPPCTTADTLKAHLQGATGFEVADIVSSTNLACERAGEARCSTGVAGMRGACRCTSAACAAVSVCRF